MDIHDVLARASRTITEREALYGSGHREHGHILKAFFPEGVTLNTPEQHTRFYLFNQILGKLNRYVKSWDVGGHEDSIHDAGNYCHLLELEDHNGGSLPDGAELDVGGGPRGVGGGDSAHRTGPVHTVDGQQQMTFQRFFQLAMKREVPDILVPEGGRAIELGPGGNPVPGATGLDLPEWDGDREPLPFPDGSVAVIHAYHFLEHLEDPIRLLREAQRVLRTGGVMNICVPYYSSNMQSQDLTHRHSFTETTWQNLFRNDYYSHRREGWKLRDRFNLIAGVVERNLALLTQLVRIP